MLDADWEEIGRDVGGGRRRQPATREAPVACHFGDYRDGRDDDLLGVVGVELDLGEQEALGAG